MKVTLLKNRNTSKENKSFANTLLNVTRITILEAICASPDSDVPQIMKITGITIASMYREIKILLDTSIIKYKYTTGSISGPRRRVYRTNYDEASFVLSMRKDVALKVVSK